MLKLKLKIEEIYLFIYREIYIIEWIIYLWIINWYYKEKKNNVDLY